MHPQILRTWPGGGGGVRETGIGYQSQNWCDNDAKKKMLQDFYDFLFARVGDKMTKTGTADLMKCASKIYF